MVDATNLWNLRPAAGDREPLDVVVVGGGPAGLAAALGLARARRSVLVIDSGQPRNAPADHAHGYLTRDGASPNDLLSAGRREVRGYGSEIVEGTVTEIERLRDGGFRIATSAGFGCDTRRVLVTTGLVDELPDIPGLRERWGRDVVHCPYCFGWELRDEPLGVLATGPHAPTQALMWRQWSRDIVLFRHTAPEPTDEQSEQLAARGIGVIDGEVAGVEVANDRLGGMRLRSGAAGPAAGAGDPPRFSARHTVLDALGVPVAEHPIGMGSQVQADANGVTAEPGVYVAGNVSDLTAGVLQAAAAGVTAAVAINADLLAEDTAHAVAAVRRARTEQAPPVAAG